MKVCLVEEEQSESEPEMSLDESDGDVRPMIVHAEESPVIVFRDEETVDTAKNVNSDDDDDDDELLEEIEQVPERNIKTHPLIPPKSCPRYFLERSGPKCFNCGQPGHQSRACPSARSLPCYLCARIGHQRHSCPEELCHNCGRPGHLSRECRAPRKRRAYGNGPGEECRRCGQVGHQASDCSLRWRQYVLVASSGDKTTSADIRHVCYNCAGLDHFGDECPYERKRRDWSAFHEPDPEFLRLAAIRPGTSDANERGRDYRSHGDRRDARDTRPSPNWQKMKSGENGKPSTASTSYSSRGRPREVTEANYYDHFDGSYCSKRREANPSGNEARCPSTLSSTATGGKHKSRSGYGPANSRPSSSSGRKDRR